MISQTRPAASAMRMRAAPAPKLALRHAVVVRAEVPESNGAAAPTPAEPMASTSAPTPAPAAAVAAPSEFAILNPVTEAINGRAAMLGFVAAMIGESTTHHSVFSEVFGKYDDFGKVSEQPFGDIGYFAVVFIISMATLMPKLIDNVNVGDRSFGPFTPQKEVLVGRVAMMGFLGLCVVELIKGSSLL